MSEKSDLLSPREQKLLEKIDQFIEAAPSVEGISLSRIDFEVFSSARDRASAFPMMGYAKRFDGDKYRGKVIRKIEGRKRYSKKSQDGISDAF